MKFVWCLILLWLFPLLSTGTVPAVPSQQQEKAEWVESKDNVDRLAAILTANRVADVSLQQNNPFGNQQQFRRYPVSAPSFFQGAIRWCPLPAVPGQEHLSYRNYNRYLTHKKEAGYYIYALRKIII